MRLRRAIAPWVLFHSTIVAHYMVAAPWECELLIRGCVAVFKHSWPGACMGVSAWNAVPLPLFINCLPNLNKLEKTKSERCLHARTLWL
jgi:hypothetical protein